MVRIYQAKRVVYYMLRDRERRAARKELEDRSVRPIQKIVRGKFGRKRAAERLAYLLHEVLFRIHDICSVVIGIVF